MSSEAQARSAARTEAILVEMQLQELREARQLTPIEIAKTMLEALQEKMKKANVFVRRKVGHQTRSGLMA